jgi:hypothetical protein
MLGDIDCALGDSEEVYVQRSCWRPAHHMQDQESEACASELESPRVCQKKKTRRTEHSHQTALGLNWFILRWLSRRRYPGRGFLRRWIPAAWTNCNFQRESCVGLTLRSLSTLSYPIVLTYLVLFFAPRCCRQLVPFECHPVSLLVLLILVLVLCLGPRLALPSQAVLSARNPVTTIQVSSSPLILSFIATGLRTTHSPVAVRTQMSTLKHTIRQQQAQLHNLENIILRGPRPIPPGTMSSPPHSPDELDLASPSDSYRHSHTPSGSMSKMKKRSSFDVLQGLAGPESSLPLPRREDGVREGGIREGVPMDFRGDAVSPNGYKRLSSPTRTLSRMSLF